MALSGHLDMGDEVFPHHQVGQDAADLSPLILEIHSDQCSSNLPIWVSLFFVARTSPKKEKSMAFVRGYPAQPYVRCSFNLPIRAMTHFRGLDRDWAIAVVSILQGVLVSAAKATALIGQVGISR